MKKTLEGNIIIFIISVIIERNCNKIICDCWNETFKKYFYIKPSISNVIKISFTESGWRIFWDPGLVFFFNSSKEWEDLISDGTSSQIWGP